MIFPLILLGVLAAAAVCQVLHFSPHLPDLVVSHWGPGGQPDGWLEKAAFCGAMILSELGVTGFFVASALVLPYIPKRWWNIPHKDYWLAPERWSGTVRYVRTQTLWAAVIIGAAMVLLWQGTINANVRPDLRWPANFWWTLIVTVAVIGVWLVRLGRHLNSVPGTGEKHEG